jgi:hypothetical protein
MLRRRKTLEFPMIPQRPALVDYVSRLTAREAFKRAEEEDKAAVG